MLKSLKARSPAAFAEQYLIESIWLNKYPPGSILPAERELAELIGVTRTTLREVLQRLARDGWITIQHGKPTLVNDYWKTGGLSILPSIVQLDEKKAWDTLEQMMVAYTAISSIYLRAAIRSEPASLLAILKQRESLEPTAKAYSEFEWALHYQATLSSGNLVYTLLVNGFKRFYLRVASFFYQEAEAMSHLHDYCHELQLIIEEDSAHKINAFVRDYAMRRAEIWQRKKSSLPDSFLADIN